MEVIVIGGGPAGLMAAGRAAEMGARVTLLEKNAILGKKLLISGGGRCNFTNAETDNHKLAAKYGKRGDFLLSPFAKFSAQSCLDFFSRHGMAYKIEDHLRAFPASDSARSVLEVLQSYVMEGQVTIKSNTQVTGMVCRDGLITSVSSFRKQWSADRFVLTTGGTSRPETGSTGDGYEWLKAIGHSVRIPEPSLVPVAVKEKWVEDLQGLSFSEVRISAWIGKERVLSRDGRFLFTHFGLSGPLVLNMATALSQEDQTAKDAGKPLDLKIDFFPKWDAGTLDRELLKKFSENPGKKFKNAMTGFLPPRLMEKIFSLSGANSEKTLHQVTKEERGSLVAFCKEFPLTFRKLMDESRAVVSSGGLKLEEVDFRTMTSRLYPNLAIAGDLLDFDRPSGGYSLQICWSTGWVAGTWAGASSS